MKRSHLLLGVLALGLVGAVVYSNSTDKAAALPPANASGLTDAQALSYLQNNADVQAAWDNSLYGSRDFATAIEWAKYHYDNFGKLENRVV